MRTWRRAAALVMLVAVPTLPGCDSKPDRPSVADIACPPAAPADGGIRGLDATLALDASTVRSGANFGGRLTLTNNTDGPIAPGDIGNPVTALVVRPGTTDVVGVYGGDVAGVGWEPTLAPGASGSTDVLGGTVGCGTGSGRRVRPGRWSAIVVVTAYLGGTAQVVARTPEVPLVVTE